MVARCKWSELHDFGPLCISTVWFLNFFLVKRTLKQELQVKEASGKRDRGKFLPTYPPPPPGCPPLYLTSSSPSSLTHHHHPPSSPPHPPPAPPLYGGLESLQALPPRAPERWERWERVPSPIEILAATFGSLAEIASEISVHQPK